MAANCLQSVGVRVLAPIWTSAVEWLRPSTGTMLVFLTSYLRPPLNGLKFDHAGDQTLHYHFSEYEGTFFRQDSE